MDGRADDSHLRWTVELTPELLGAAEPELAAVLAAWSDAAFERARARRRIPEWALRAAGLAVAVLGLLVAWATIVLARPCAPARSTALAYAGIPVFVIGGTIFAFLPGLVGELRGKVRRGATRRAARLVQTLRARVPCAVAYDLGAGVLAGGVSPGAPLATDLGTIRAAVMGTRLGCLAGRRWPGAVRRIVWLGDGAMRRGFCDAMQRAGVEVIDLGPAAPASWLPIAAADAAILRRCAGPS